MPTKKRAPSPKRLAKGLERAAHEAEDMANRLQRLGFEGYAHSVRAAANLLSDAQLALEGTLP